MSSEQKYRPLKAGEILSNGDQFFTVDGRWVDYTADRWGTSISQYATGRRPVAGETETVDQSEVMSEVVSEQAADESSTTLDDALRCNTELAEKLAEMTRQRDELQEAYNSSRDCLVQGNLIVQDGEKAKAEVEASRRMYMEAMKALEREVVQHRETNRTLDEVCRERDALQEQLSERAGEPRKAEILDFLGVQIAVIPYLQAAVNKDAQRELTIAGRTLQMVHAAIESDRIGRDGEGKEANDGKE